MTDAAKIIEVNLAGTMRLLNVVRGRMATGGAIMLFASSSAYQVETGSG